MATRTKLPSTLSLDTENVAKVKSAIPTNKLAPAKRTALLDLGNKITSHEQHVVKKPGGLAALKKTTSNVPVLGIPSKVTATSRLIRNNALSSNTGRLPILKTDKIMGLKKQDSIVSLKQVLLKKEAMKQPAKEAMKQLAKEAVADPVKESYSTGLLNNVALLDLDKKDDWDPLLVSEYVQDIFMHLRDLEVRMPVNKTFLKGHLSSPRMRCVLIDWMVDVLNSFKCLPETLHLSVSLVDRYLQENLNIGRETLQLVGTAAMWIAAKYEEMMVPEIYDLVSVCDETFSKRQILEMEKEILKRLKFQVGRPLSLHFLRRYNKISMAVMESHSLGKYLIELALIDYEICHIPPSLQAAAACCLSSSIMGDLSDPALAWTRTLSGYSDYKYSVLKSVIIKLATVLVKAETWKYQAVRKKYAGSKFAKISLHPKLKGPLVKKLVAQAELLKT